MIVSAEFPGRAYIKRTNRPAHTPVQATHFLHLKQMR